MSRSVLEASLPVSGSSATIELDAISVAGDWNARVRIAVPQLLEIDGVRSLRNSRMRFTFAIPESLVGLRYELDVFADGEAHLTIARGVLSLGSTILRVGSINELESEVDAATAYTHVQNAASTTWLVVHNLGRYPNVTIVDSAYTEVEGDVTYIDKNTIQLDFSAAFGGQAFIGS